MSSQERIEANRANSLNSTGPVTPEGKARASRNALKHGLLSNQVVLETEDRAEFEEFRQALWLDLKPVGAMEELLVERIVAQHWRLRRAMRLDTCLIDRDEGKALFLEATKLHLRDLRPEGATVHPTAMGEALTESMGAKHSAYETMRRYERTIQRDLESCVEKLDYFQEIRKWRGNLAGPSNPPAAGEWPTPAVPPAVEQAVGFVSQEGAPEGQEGAACHAPASLREEARGAATRPSTPPANDDGSSPRRISPGADMAPAVGFVSQPVRPEAPRAAERPVLRDITGRRIEPAGPAAMEKGKEAR